MARHDVRGFSSDGKPFFLSVSPDAQTPIHLVLTDGCCSWTGCIEASQLNVPMRYTAEMFEKRLSEGLRGLPDCAADSLRVNPSAAGGVQLEWSTTFATSSGFRSKATQTIELRPEQLPGEHLRALLQNLAEDIGERQAACEAMVVRGNELAAERSELTTLNAELARRKEEESGALQRRCLDLLNAKKRRIAALEDELERADRGEDGFDGAISDYSDAESVVSDGPPRATEAAGLSGGAAEEASAPSHAARETSEPVAPAAPAAAQPNSTEQNPDVLFARVWDMLGPDDV